MQGSEHPSCSQSCFCQFYINTHPLSTTEDRAEIETRKQPALGTSSAHCEAVASGQHPSLHLQPPRLIRRQRNRQMVDTGDSAPPYPQGHCWAVRHQHCRRGEPASVHQGDSSPQVSHCTCAIRMLHDPPLASMVVTLRSQHVTMPGLGANVHSEHLHMTADF